MRSGAPRFLEIQNIGTTLEFTNGAAPSVFPGLRVAPSHKSTRPNWGCGQNFYPSGMAFEKHPVLYKNHTPSGGWLLSNRDLSAVVFNLLARRVEHPSRHSPNDPLCSWQRLACFWGRRGWVTVTWCRTGDITEGLDLMKLPFWGFLISLGPLEGLRDALSQPFCPFPCIESDVSRWEISRRVRCHSGKSLR